MRTIRAVCPLCTGEIDLRPAEITLHVVEIPTGPPNRYGFECPDCQVFVVKPAGPAAVELLLEGGVVVATGDLAPWERPPSCHPEQPAPGPRINESDVHLMRDLLMRDDWFERLLRACEG